MLMRLVAEGALSTPAAFLLTLTKITSSVRLGLGCEVGYWAESEVLGLAADLEC